MNRLTKYINKFIALVLVVVAFSLQCNVVIFADENIPIPTVETIEAETLKGLSTATPSEVKIETASISDAEYENDDVEDENESNMVLSAKDILKGREKEDFVPEQLVVSMRGGIDGLYLTLDEDKDTSFLDDLSFESLAVISDKYDTSDENNAISSDEMLEMAQEELGDFPDEDVFLEEYECEVAIDEYEVYKVLAPGYDTKTKLNSLIKKLEKLPAVQYAELNKVMTVDSISNPNDYTNRQWENNGSKSAYQTGVMAQEIKWNVYDAQKNPAPMIPTTSNDPVVVIMDTGIDYSHKDLDDVMWDDGLSYTQLTSLGGGKYGFNACNGDSTDPLDDNGHGTHIAGIIASEWNNEGTSGVTSGIKLMAVKIGDKDAKISSSNVISAFDYVNTAQDENVNIVTINCSFSGDYYGDMLNQFVTRAGEKGAVSCFSSGNDSVDIDRKLTGSGGLSNNPYAVIVNACDDSGELSSFSNYGLKSTDVAAAGVGIYSTTIAKNAKADACAENILPVALVGSKEAITDFDGDASYFTYEKEDCDVQNVIGKGLNGTNCVKVSANKPSQNGMILDVKYNPQNLSVVPKAFTFAFKCPKVDNCVGIYVNAYNAKSGAVLASDSYYLNDEWIGFSAKLSKNELDEQKETIKLQIFCADQSFNPVTYGFDFYIDRIMFTNGTCKYEIQDGTSMSAAFASAEATILSEYFYENLNKSERAKNISARIKGSVDLFVNAKDRQKLGSGGMIRIDKAVRGETVPVINDIVITKSGDKYKADLNGYFFDGNAAKSENDERFIDLSIDDVKVDVSQIISNSGTKISFYIPNDKITNEHKFSVTSTKGVGDEFLECRVADITSKDRFVEIPINENSCIDMINGKPLCIKAYNGKMFLLSGNARTEKLSLWKQEIPNVLSGINVSGDWTLIDDSYLYSNNNFNHSMAIVNGKLVGTGKKAGKWYIWEYDIASNQMREIAQTGSLYNNSGIFYAGGKLFLTYSTLVKKQKSTDPQQYSINYYILSQDGNYTWGDRYRIQETLVKTFADIIYDGKNYYTILGKTSSEEGSYSIEKLILDGDKVTNAILVNNNVISGISNLYNAEYSVATSVASNGQKAIFTGPAIAYGDYIEADTYMVSDVTKRLVPVDRFVSTSSLLNVCSTIDGNYYYVMANTRNSENSWIYAYTDITTLKEYKHKEGGGGGDEPEKKRSSSSNSSSGGLITPIYPAYVEKGGKWSRVVLLSGKVIWRFTDSKGQICTNRWMAIPDEEGKIGGPFGWYRFDASGNMLTGWYTDDKGRKFYLNPSEGSFQGKMMTGWQLIDGKWYYFKETGKDDFGILVPDKVRS